MASPYQQVFQRKLIYLGLVVMLLVGSWLWRTQVVEASARDLALLEESRGEVRLVDSAVRLTLFGSRGLVTCALWISAIEKQKKNQWNELELYVRSLTKLQPHFITPWQFQSWNLAYNVSVESDRPRDKFFYIARGIQLLADGERQNRNNPDLRKDIGFYHQHKIMQHDEGNVLRSLFQLSCIPPAKREPDSFRTADGKGINWPEFRKFCEEHPQLVRRLHSPPLPYDPRREYRKFRCGSAQEVIQFLEDNRAVPSLYVDKEVSTKDYEQFAFKPNELERFPVMPPELSSAERPGRDPEEWTQEKLERESPPDELDAYHVARAWYSYAQEPLTAPGDLPGSSEPITDRQRQRMPRAMSTIIFRSAPARAQSYIAERLEDEGWFDEEPFEPRGWFEVQDTVKVGESRKWGADSWNRAFRLFDKYGRDNKLRFEQTAQEENLRLKAARFRKEFNLQSNELPPALNLDLLSEEQREGYQAVMFLFEYAAARQRTNFFHFWVRAETESKDKTVQARKRFHQAEQLRLVEQSPLQALEKYEEPEGLKGWREVLEENRQFRSDDFIQEHTFDTELKYVRLYRSIHGTNLTRNLALQAFLGQAASLSPAGADWAMLGLVARPQLLPEATIIGPFDKDSQGIPFVPEEIRNIVLERRDLKKGAAQSTGVLTPIQQPTTSSEIPK